MPSYNLGGFLKGLDLFDEQVRSDAAKTIRQIAFAVDRELVRRTPVGNPDLWKANRGKSRSDPGYVGRNYTGGRARANWLASLETPTDEVVEKPDPSGASSLARMSQVTSQFRLGQKIFISNSLPYIQRLDEGWSSQAPTGMVAASLQVGVKTVLKR